MILSFALLPSLSISVIFAVIDRTTVHKAHNCSGKVKGVNDEIIFLVMKFIIPFQKKISICNYRCKQTNNFSDFLVLDGNGKLLNFNCLYLNAALKEIK